MSRLSPGEKCEISTLKKHSFRNSAIAKPIGRDKSTIGRELKRNADVRSMEYRADLVQRKADQRHKEKNKYKAFTPE
jgi:transposase, IS30 family